MFFNKWNKNGFTYTVILLDDKSVFHNVCRDGILINNSFDGSSASMLS